MKKISIKLGNGDLGSGFNSVNIELKQDSITIWEGGTCSLKAAPELKSSLNEWVLLYEAIVRLNTEHKYRSLVFKQQPIIRNVSIQDIRNLHDRLKIELNKWLAESDFHRVEKSLRTKLHADEEITVSIQSSQKSIWQLPWYLWDFFNDYPLAVDIFSTAQNSDISNISIQGNGKVDILALFGIAPELELNRDLEYLESLPDVEVKAFETNLAQDIAKNLQLFSPDILCVSLHGDSVEYENDRDVIIYLDPQTPLEISTLKVEIKKAVERGLQIFIGNFCLGLDVAHQLSDVNIPYLIVMRAEIPNDIAQAFIENLLAAYSSGTDFVRAFQLARYQLSISTDSWLKFANWLPILFHNPLSHPVAWQDLLSTSHAPAAIPPAKPEPNLTQQILATISAPQHRWWTSLGLSLVLTGLGMGLKSLAEPLCAGRCFENGTRIAPIEQLENIIIDRASQLQLPHNSNFILIKYEPTIVFGELRDPSILANTLEKIEQNTKPQAVLTDLKLGKYLPTNKIVGGELSPRENRQWKLNPNVFDGLNSIRIEEIDGLSSKQLKDKFNEKRIIIGSKATLANQLLTADSNDINSDLNLLKICPKSAEFIWIMIWCNISMAAVWQVRSSNTLPNHQKLFVPTTIAIVGAQIIGGGVVLILGNCVPITVTTIAIIAAGTIYNSFPVKN
jgi:hypothetical protein